MSNKGFTVIELLVVIGILALLLTIALVAINPSDQFAQVNDTKRKSDIGVILNAIGQYQVDNRGQIPAVISTSEGTISNTSVDLCSYLVPQYIAALPVDPEINDGTEITDCDDDYDTGYTIIRTTNNRITVSAPNAQQDGEEITATR